MHRLVCARTVPLVGAAAMLAFLATPAQAFERQLHLGGGIGGAVVTGGYELGPALGLHSAYGLTDVFDLRLELQGSRNAIGLLPVSFYGARLGVAYKIDLMRLLPYVGLCGGGFAVSRGSTSVFRPSAGGYFGLDYAWTDHLGLGVLASADLVIKNPAVTVSSLLFRVEYRVDL